MPGARVLSLHTHTHTHLTYTPHLHTPHAHTSQAPFLAASGAETPTGMGNGKQPSSRLPPPPRFLPPFYILVTCISTASSFIGPWFPAKASRLWQLWSTQTWPAALTTRGGGQPWWCWPP